MAANTIAIRMLDAGPAAATSPIPPRGFLKLRMSTGTGFAQPKSGAPVNTAIVGNNTVPTQLICAIGSMVNLPRYFAVASPSLSAAFA